MESERLKWRSELAGLGGGIERAVDGAGVEHVIAHKMYWDGSGDWYFLYHGREYDTVDAAKRAAELRAWWPTETNDADNE